MSSRLEAVDLDLIHEQVRDFIRTNFLYVSSAPLTDDTSLFEQGIIDETGILELVMFIEETYSIQVTESELVPENFDTVAEIVGFIAERLGEE